MSQAAAVVAELAVVRLRVADLEHRELGLLRRLALVVPERGRLHADPREQCDERAGEGEAQQEDGGARALGSEVSLNSSYLVVLCGTSSWTDVRLMWLAG